MNTADLTLKQMFDISAKLVAEQDVISGLETIGWEKHSWKDLSLIDDERIISLQRAKVYVFSESVLCLGKIHQNPDANEAWKKRIEWITTSQSYRDFDWEKHPKISQEEIYLCRCSTTFLVERKTMNRNVWHTLESYLCMQGSLVQDTGHSLVPVLRKSGTPSKKTVHKESGTISRKRCWWNSPKADVRFSVLRLHCSEVNSEAKDMENCRFTLLPLRKNSDYFSRNRFCKSAPSSRSSRENV